MARTGRLAGGAPRVSGLPGGLYLLRVPAQGEQPARRRFPRQQPVPLRGRVAFPTRP